VEFVSAGSLPKGPSIRKKFVPPFKKPEKAEKEENLKSREPAGAPKELEESMDPRHPGL
jgi:hypothetical protein